MFKDMPNCLSLVFEDNLASLEGHIQGWCRKTGNGGKLAIASTPIA
jgi:hypothetical protein